MKGIYPRLYDVYASYAIITESLFSIRFGFFLKKQGHIGHIGHIERNNFEV